LQAIQAAHNGRRPVKIKALRLFVGFHLELISFQNVFHIFVEPAIFAPPAPARHRENFVRSTAACTRLRFDPELFGFHALWMVVMYSAC
jgi:hypothetical protein